MIYEDDPFERREALYDSYRRSIEFEPEHLPLIVAVAGGFIALAVFLRRGKK